MGNKIATREAYGKALVKLSNLNENVVVLDADLSKSTKTADFKAVAPERFINMGIAESNMMGVAAGLSTCGKIPFASTFAMFAAGRAFEQIRNSICYPKLNVKVCATHAGLTVGEDGATHQSIEDISLMRSIPNMLVINPADAVETEAAILAVAEYNGPCYVRLGRLPVEDVFDDNYDFKIGKANTVVEGTDVTVAATGLLVQEAMEAAKMLKEEGISVRVLNFGTIKPLDGEILKKASAETKFIVTAEEHSIIGGLGGAVAEYVSENCPTKVIRMGVMDRFGESGKGEEMLEKFNLTAKDIVKKVKENM